MQSLFNYERNLSSRLTHQIAGVINYVGVDETRH